MNKGSAGFFAVFSHLHHDAQKSIKMPVLLAVIGSGMTAA
jgi:hypothetical protein